MKNSASSILVSLISCFLTLLSCAGEPSPQASPPPQESAPVSPPALPAAPPEAPLPEEVFDPATISREIFDSTKTDVQKLIQDLNGIIRARNYRAWVSYLSDDYLRDISSPDFLAQTSASARLRQQRIVLGSPEDYFNHVVVPSRANDRVDDIEFTSQNRVKAYTVTPNGQRLRLYELEKTGNSWKIMN
ncbi:MAG: hypothetical protein LBI85_02715 [Spirochaetaceae bacterium]|jgi:hypothetical protein|nr:hypothetical protein [Spirochaetaceae bacterium]